LLILDEPTGVLTPQEWSRLADVLRSLAGDGHAIVFITHKLDEVFEIASRCTVLRDGRVIGTRAIADTTKQELARLMVGREVTLRAQREALAPGRPVLEVEGLRLADHEREILRGLDFTVHEAEVFAIAGVEGNGQTELVEVLSGTRDPSAGRIVLDRAACGVIPEDRQRTALALDLPIADNLMMKEFARRPFSRHGLLIRRPARARSERLLGEFDIRAPGVDTIAGALSGGNQQKVVLARELDGDRRLLIAAQPTRGLDVGAMEFVYARLAEFKRRGGAILLISSELDEILSIADRIAVMVSGTFVDVVDADGADPEALGLMMGGRRRVAPAGHAAV
jgi:simple sugar transport system ATP-binding protein